jgi:hypothetical protein
MSDEPTVTDVWNEITISGSGIGITLYSESAGTGARVEDETWYTFDELQSATGDIVSLNLSDETRERLSTDESWSAPSTDEVLESAGQPSVHGQQSAGQQSVDLQVGDLVEDENPPDWTDGDVLEVVEILSDTRADEYYFGEVITVATVNPEYPDDDPVVMATFIDGSEAEYAFPASRLERKD